MQLLIDTVPDGKNRLIFLKDDTSNPCFESIGLKIKLYSIFQLHNNYYLFAVREYFAIAIILADQNHAIRLYQSNNIIMYMIIILNY